MVFYNQSKKSRLVKLQSTTFPEQHLQNRPNHIVSMELKVNWNEPNRG